MILMLSLVALILFWLYTVSMQQFHHIATLRSSKMKLFETISRYYSLSTKVWTDFIFRPMKSNYLTSHQYNRCKTIPCFCIQSNQPPLDLIFLTLIFEPIIPGEVLGEVNRWRRIVGGVSKIRTVIAESIAQYFANVF